MNASPRLLRHVNRSTVLVESVVPATNPSTPVLGVDRKATGVVLAPSGMVLTVHYAVLGAASVSIHDHKGGSTPARVVALDFHGGFAVLAPESPVAPGLPAGGLADVTLGEDVFLLAVGDDAGRRVSDGHLISLEPFFANWEFGLDTAIVTSVRSPGLGGAPLVDRQGRVIGISCLDLGEVGRFVLAIPTGQFVDFEQELLDNGRRVTRPPRAWAGFFCYALQRNVVVAAVLPESPAALSGLEAGDVIVAVDGERVRDQRGVYEALWARRPGDHVSFRVLRGEDMSELMVYTMDAEAFFA